MILDRMRLKGKVALVTGGSQGLGLGMARALAKALYADPAQAERIVSRIPIGRPGTPDDLTGAVVLLASPASSYVTGQVLWVDGGWLLMGGDL